MKKHVVVITLFVCLMAQPLQSQTGLPPEWSMEIYFETGYFLPAKESFRADYEPRLFLGSTSIPLSLGIGLQLPFKGGTTLFLSGRMSKQVVEWNNDTSLLLVPMVAGLKVKLPAESYVGIGIGVSVAIFTSEYMITYGSSPEAIGLDRESQFHIGPNVNLQAGVDRHLGKSLKLGLVISYDLSRTGSVTKGGLGNVGGMFTAIRFTLIP